MARQLNECMCECECGNIYGLAKTGSTEGKRYRQRAGSMTGMSELA